MEYKQLKIRVSQDLYDEFTMIREANGQTLQWILEQAIKDHIVNHGGVIDDI
jgi:predicted transcriptional regulator